MTGGILALDPASEITGWAYSDPGDPMPQWGHVVLKKWNETARDHAGRVGARLALFLEARIEVFKPAFIVREAMYVDRRRMNTATILPLAGIAWQIDTVAELHRIPCHKVQSVEFVKAFTGRGRYRSSDAKKQATIAACKMRGWVVGDDNEADALALLCYAEAVLFPEFRLSMRRPAGPLFMKPLDDPRETRSI
jgi:Holliday junction resolvasome RuvABC endonuclease subunit